MKFHANIGTGLANTLNLILFVIGLSAGSFLWGSSAVAAKGLVAGPHYFYSLAQGLPSGYDIPECAKLADTEYKKLKRHCEPMGENSKKCATERTVTLKAGVPSPMAPSPSEKAAAASPKANATPNPKVMKEAQKVDDTTKTYKLDYIVFVSEADCKEAQDHELEGE